VGLLIRGDVHGMAAEQLLDPLLEERGRVSICLARLLHKKEGA
jgi:hypothetical protein